MVLLPSTKLVNIKGFIFLDIASCSSCFGVAKQSKGLFLPLPMAMTSRDNSLAKSKSSTAATGSSPSPTVTIQLFLSASSLNAKPIVASVSTFRSIRCMPLFKTFLATSAPDEGVPVASMTISNSKSSIDCIVCDKTVFLSWLVYFSSAFSSLS